jgi:GTPase SAR1 family protein
LYNFPPKEYYSLGGYVLVFSLVDQSSFTVLDDFIQQIYKCKGDRTPKDTIPIVLVGNKHDLLAMHKPRVSNGEILEFMNKYNLEYYFEASAKKNYNINDLFRCVSELVVDHSALRFKDQITKFQEGPPKEKKCTVM